MTPLRPDRRTSAVPPLRAVPASGRPVPRLPHRFVLLRGALVLAVLALPVLGIRVADRTVPAPEARAAQVAAIARVAPMAAISPFAEAR